ncbi:MAG: thioredoxin family protein [Planctomycetota bacterium]
MNSVLRFAGLIAIAAATSGIAAVPAASQAASPTWYDQGFNGALDLAGEHEQRLLVYFWMPGSAHCTNLWTETLGHDAERDRLAQFVCFSADVTQTEGGQLAQRYGVQTLPTLLFIGHHGEADDAVVGYVPQAQFDREVDRVVADQQTVAQLRRLAFASPKDLARRFDLGIKLAFVGERVASERVFAHIRREDPEGRTIGGAKILLRDAADRVRAEASDPDDPSTWDLSGVAATVCALHPPEVVFQGWDWIAGTEENRGNGTAARAAFERAWPHLAAANQPLWPANVAATYWRMQAELTETDQTFLQAKLEEVYGPVHDQWSGRQDANSAPAGQRETAARQIGALAQGWFLAGRRDAALAAGDLAGRLAPDNGEIQSLVQALRAGN